MQLIELAIKRASAANLASPSLKIRPLIQRVFNRFFRDAGFLLFEGRDLGFKAKRGQDSGLKICSGRGITIGITGLQENIGRNDLIELLYWGTPI